MNPTSTDEESVVGDESHIVSREANAPRYDPDFPDADVDSYENLLLLCKVHHKMVDDQKATYTAEILRQTKMDHEKWVSEKLSTTKSNHVGDLPPWPKEITTNRKKTEVTVLFTDIREFTDFVEIRAGDRKVGEFIDRYYKMTFCAIREHEGWINKWLGDGVMALWLVNENAPEETVNKSIMAALKIQKGFRELRGSKRIYEGLGIGISLNMGSPLLGSFGIPPDCVEYTAICKPVNLASRLVQHARDQILATGEIMRNTNGNFLSVQTEPMRFKGIEDEITPFWILREKEDSEQNMCDEGCDDREFCKEKLGRGRQKKTLLCTDCQKCEKTDCQRKAGRTKRGEIQLCCWECTHYVKCLLSWYRGYNGHDTLVPCHPALQNP